MPKTKHKRTKRLISLMDKYEKNASDIANMLSREANTVRVWRCEGAGKVIPALVLELLEFKLEHAARS